MITTVSSVSLNLVIPDLESLLCVSICPPVFIERFISILDVEDYSLKKGRLIYSSRNGLADYPQARLFYVG